MNLDDIVMYTTSGVLASAFVTNIMKNYTVESRRQRFRTSHPIDDIKREMKDYLREHPYTAKGEKAQEALQLLKEAEDSHYPIDFQEKIDSVYKIYEEQF